MLKNDITYFQELSNFDSLKDFNNNLEMHLADFKNEYTTKELIVLKRLVRFSAKVFGVSNVSIRTLVEAVEAYDKVKVSEATFHRMKRKSIKLGLFDTRSCRREDSSQSSNLYVFLPYSIDTPDRLEEVEETPSNQDLEKKDVTPLKASNISKTNKTIKTRKGIEVMNFDSSFISSNVPRELVETVKPFFSKASEIYAIYKRLKQATNHAHDTVETNLGDYVSTFKQSLYRLKLGYVDGDFLGYLYGAFKKTCNKIIYERNAKGYSNSVYFDWIGA